MFMLVLCLCMRVFGLCACVCWCCVYACVCLCGYVEGMRVYVGVVFTNALRVCADTLRVFVMVCLCTRVFVVIH